MFFRLSLEAHENIVKRVDSLGFYAAYQRIEFLLVPKRYPKMPGIHLWFQFDFVWCQMTHELVSEKIQCNSVSITTRKPAPNNIHEEPCGGIEVLTGNGNMENVFTLAHIITRETVLVYCIRDKQRLWIKIVEPPGGIVIQNSEHDKRVETAYGKLTW